MAVCQYPDWIRENLLKFCCIHDWNSRDFLLVPFLYLMFTLLGHANKQVINLDYCISWCVCCVALGNKYKSVLMTTIESWPVVDIVGKFHTFSRLLLKAYSMPRTTIVSKNDLWYHIPYSIVTVKIGKRNKENMRIHFMLIHWMLYSQFIQMFIKNLLWVRIFILLGTSWDPRCLHARFLAKGLQSK